MTVLDSSALVDYLLGAASRRRVSELIVAEREVAAPDLIVFEALAVLRRMVARELIETARALAAVEDLNDVPVRLFSSLPLRLRAWELRENLSAADALFVALSERLGEPFATGDRRLAAAIASMPDVSVEVLVLPGAAA